MVIDFARIRISSDGLVVTLEQPMANEFNQIITFPFHQAESICDAILLSASTKKNRA